MLGTRAKEVQDALGQVRDLQVQVAWLEALLRLRPAIDPLIAELRAQISDRAAGLGIILAGWPPMENRPVPGTLEGRLGGKQMRRALTRHLRQVEKHLAGLRRAFSARGAPRARVAVKKLRYASELLGVVFPKATALLKKELVPLQRGLGNLHDADVWLGHWTKDAARREEHPQAALLVVGAAAVQRRQALAAARRDVTRWEKAKVGERVKHLLKG